MFTVPARCAPSFADAVTVTLSPPDTLDAVVIHVRLSRTDQLQ